MATQAQVEKFINSIAPLIQKYAKEKGYKVCSPIIAQACCESAYGTSSLGYKYHNYFGLKCGSAWKGKSVNMRTKEEYTVGTLTDISANFRAYDSMEDGVKGYFDFVNNKRYQGAYSTPLKDCVTPLGYLEALKKCGYATSSTYVNTNMKIINNYNLTRFDTFNTVTNPYTVPTRTLRRRIPMMYGDDVKWVQYNVGTKVDGWFGKDTEAKVKEYQLLHNLTIDGIVGMNTRAEMLKTWK